MNQNNNSPNTIEKKLNDWKNKLIDLSRRNRLLNFKKNRSSTLKIIDEIPSEIYKSLVVDEEAFDFLTYDEESKENSINSGTMEFFEYEPEGLEDKHKDLFLQTDLKDVDLEKVLKNIYFKSNQLMQEQGYNILYLALGVLDWYEADSSDVLCKSPLIMVPVSLTKKTMKSKYKLSIKDDDPFVNPALQHKLKCDFNIILDDINTANESEFDPQQYFVNIQNKIKDLKRWKITNEIYLGLFSFAKFSMFKDIENFTNHYLNNKTIQALAGSDTSNNSSSNVNIIKSNEIDEKVNPLNSFQVLDADSSQQETIEASKSGNNIIIQGPPGTGKSQTIANIIAEFLASGKTVLFVSEKMAALEVVYKRLVSTGLGKFCLEVHSHKSNKFNVINQLKKAFESENFNSVDVANFNDLKDLKSKLKIYTEKLHKKMLPFGKSPYWFIGQLNYLKNIKIFEFDFSELALNSYEQYKKNIEVLESFKERIEHIGHPTSHPFWGTSISEISELGYQKIINNLNEIICLIKDTINLNKKFNDITGKSLSSLNETIKYLKAFQKLYTNHCIPESFLIINDYKNFNIRTLSTLNLIDNFNIKKEIILDFINVFPIDINEIELIIKNLHNLSNLNEYYDSLLKLFPDIDEFIKTKTKILTCMDDFSIDINGIELIIKNLHNLSNLNEYYDSLLKLFPDIDEFVKIKEKILTKFKIEIFVENINEINQSLKINFRSLLRYFKPSYYKLIKKISQYFTNTNNSSSYSALCEDMEMLLKYKILEDKIKNISESVYMPLGKIWKYEGTNTSKLSELVQKILDLKQIKDRIYSTSKEVFKPLESLWKYEATNTSQLSELVQKILDLKQIKDRIYSSPEEVIKPLENLWKYEKSDTAIIAESLKWLIEYNEFRLEKNDETTFKKYVLNSKNITEELINVVNDLDKKTLKIGELKLNIENFLIVDSSIVYPTFNSMSIDLILNIYEKWLCNILQLTDWTRFKRSYLICCEYHLKPFIDDFMQKDVNYNFIDSFKKSFLYYIFEKIRNNEPALKNFDSLYHDNNVSKFKSTDKLQLEINKHRIIEKLHTSKPDQNWQGSKGSELGYLQRQFSLKRGHDSIRNLFSKVPKLVQKISPCFMMSPLSLAQYINPELLNFDLVIFDEASQMSPEDSLGAITRGSQLVVVGDTKQLPPTSFFQKEVSSDDEYSEDIDELQLPDLDSILEQCLTIGMKAFTLKWHYRSKNESLIHFSNKNFYENKLITFPSPLRDNSCGIEFRLFQDDDTSNNNDLKSLNVIEAKNVAAAVFEHLNKNPEKSIGVGTFNQKQQLAIIDELEILRKENPDFEEYFNSTHEPIFVKNLETIQGDERDVIYISIGYRKAKNGKLSMNFGPLNRDGGERRLNVLVTRAREKILVFSSITGDDFDLSSTKSIGVYKLKEYLDFARSHCDTKLLENDINIFNSFDEDNIFEVGVCNELKNQGIKFVPQLGHAGYKIDFAILHPENPSKFILAVECDGASYHSLHTVRDRDRLRQEVLENLGWNFHRIWSTDWFLNPKREIEKLKVAIEKSKQSNVEVNKKEILTEKPKLCFNHVSSNNTDGYYGIKIIPYVEFEYNKFVNNQFEGYDRNYNILLDIIKTESPIHIDLIYERMAFCFNIKRITSKTQQIIYSMIQKLKNDQKIIRKHQFIYYNSTNLKVIRKRENLLEPFNFEYIAPEEIYNTIMIILRKEFAFAENEIYSKVVKFLGYNKAGQKLQAHINEVIDCMLKNNHLVKDEEGKYKANESLKSKNIDTNINSL